MPSVILMILVMSGGVQKEIHIVPFETLEECQYVQHEDIDHAGDGYLSKCYYTAEVFNPGDRGSEF